MEELIAWLEEQLRIREWQPSDLARRAGLGNSSVQRVMAGTRRAGKDVCQKIAMALGEPPEKIYRLAGLLPPVPPEAEQEEEFVNNFRLLPQAQKGFILDAMRGLQKKPSRTETEPELPPQKEYQDKPDKEILGEIWDSLDTVGRQAIFDYARWQYEEQYRRRSSDKPRISEEKKAEWWRDMGLIDLRLWVEGATPEERKELYDLLSGIVGNSVGPV